MLLKPGCRHEFEPEQFEAPLFFFFFLLRRVRQDVRRMDRRLVMGNIEWGAPDGDCRLYALHTNFPTVQVIDRAPKLARTFRLDDFSENSIM